VFLFIYFYQQLSFPVDLLPKNSFLIPMFLFKNTFVTRLFQRIADQERVFFGLSRRSAKKLKCKQKTKSNQLFNATCK